MDGIAEKFLVANGNFDLQDDSDPEAELVGWTQQNILFNHLCLYAGMYVTCTRACT